MVQINSVKHINMTYIHKFMTGVKPLDHNTIISVLKRNEDDFDIVGTVALNRPSLQYPCLYRDYRQEHR